MGGGHGTQTAVWSKTDKITGRIKEAVGALTDNDHLKREGQRAQAVGAVTEAAESAAQQENEHSGAGSRDGNKTQWSRPWQKVKNA